MSCLLKEATVFNEGSSFHLQKVDIHIAEGLIKAIGKDLNVPNVPVVQSEFLGVSAGWLDLGVQIGDPGFEHREDLDSACDAASRGGFTAIACWPNTHPVIQSKSEILYIKRKTLGKIVDFFPIGGVSENGAGKDITEMLDMKNAGALAFSDGLNSIQDSGLMKRALLYVKSFGGLIINQPYDKTISGEGQIHEGAVSTMLGMTGIPSLAETLMIQRDLQLLEYTQSRLHIANVSSKGGVQAIKMAKQNGLKVTASVPALNLFAEDQILSEFDVNFKVLPPLRMAEDRLALMEGLKDGTIDFISSNHIPLEQELKKLEFPYAEFGAIGMETAFSIANTSLENKVELHQLIRSFSEVPRNILGLPVPMIGVGEIANLTIFDPTLNWTVKEEDIKSKSKNCPVLGNTLKGRVLGIFNNHQSEIFVLQ